MLLLKSGLVGLLTGLIAALFHTLLDLADNWRRMLHHNIDESTIILPLFCVLTGSAVVLSLFLVKRILPVKFVGGLLAIGSGMVLGREGPTIHMGSALGTMVGGESQQNRFQHHVLVAAGAAAGLAAAFNAPLAGLIFVTEEMRDQFKYNFHSLMAVTLSATTAVIVVQFFNGRQPDIANASFLCPALSTFPLFALLGVCFGVIGTQFNRLLIYGVSFGKRLKGPKPYLFAALVAVSITAAAYFFPAVAGSGHNALELALNNDFSTRTMLAIFVLRFLFSLFSYSIGTPGGIFAPMLALGTFFGLWYGHVVAMLFPGLVEYPGVFAIGGMGALFAATVQAPVTGIVLIIEMTRSYELILPLMVTCLSASLVANRMGGQPIYSRLAKLR
jgi:CIC family chloride channel protein